MAKALQGRKNAKAKKIKDMKNGTSANDHMVDIEGDDDDEGEGIGHNKFQFSGETLAEFLEVVDATDAEIASNNKENAAKNQPHRKKLAGAMKRLVKDGYPTREMGTLVARHRAQRKLENIDAKLNDDQKLTFAQMTKALGGLSELPLGQAALRETVAEANQPKH